MSELRLRRRLLGIDFGEARIGLAISDELGMLAHPLETIRSNANAIARIAEIVRERDISRVVVGLPRHMSGDAGSKTTEVFSFVEKLRSAITCDVTTQDERLTTVAAQRVLHDAGRDVRKSRGVIDQVAAQMILQTYLDSMQRECPPD